MKREQIMSNTQLAGRVTRWHTWPMIRKPSIAEHSSRVATLYVELWGMPRAEVLYYSLVHDHGEFTAGDNPFASKALVPGLRENLNRAEEIGRTRLGIVIPDISEVEFLKFKVCDLLEMFETSVVEWNMGNRYAGCCVADCADAAMELAKKLDALKEVCPGGTTPSDAFRRIQSWVYNHDYRGRIAYELD